MPKKQPLTPAQKAAQQAAEQELRRAVKYKPFYNYFANWSADALYTWYCQYTVFHRDRAVLHVGKMNDAVICRALWTEMSRNPVRFGNVSPFIVDGRESIFRFCDKHHVLTDELLIKIQGHLRDYLTKNSQVQTNSKQWRDVVVTDGYGCVTYSKAMYGALASLRDAIRVICDQNVADLRAKRGPYRDAMVRLINATTVPKFVPLNVEPGKPITPKTEEFYDFIDHDTAYDNLQNSYDTLSDRPADQRADIQQEYEYYKSLHNQNDDPNTR